MQTTIDDIIRIADDLHLESASQDLAYLKGRVESAGKAKPLKTKIIKAANKLNMPISNKLSFAA